MNENISNEFPILMQLTLIILGLIIILIAFWFNPSSIIGTIIGMTGVTLIGFIPYYNIRKHMGEENHT